MSEEIRASGKKSTKLNGTAGTFTVDIEPFWDGRYYLFRGWINFAEAHAVEYRSLMLFIKMGVMEFEVIVFNQSDLGMATEWYVPFYPPTQITNSNTSDSEDFRSHGRLSFSYIS